jgi:hypothetical protein
VEEDAELWGRSLHRSEIGRWGSICADLLHVLSRVIFNYFIMEHSVVPDFVENLVLYQEIKYITQLSIFTLGLGLENFGVC